MEGKGHYRIVGILPGEDSVGNLTEFVEIEKDIIENVAIPIVFEEVFWFSTYKVHSRKASAFQNQNCFIAGDAAHIHTPAGGQGMNTGIQDAYNLAWKIAGIFKGEINENVLKTYSSERGENAKHLLQTTDRMFEIMSGANDFLNFIRLNIMPGIIGFVTSNPFIKKHIFPLISQTGIRYSPNELIIGSAIGKAKAGQRMPFFINPDGKQIFDFIQEPSFKLLFFGADNNNRSTQLKKGNIKMVFYAFHHIPPSIFGTQKDFYILLRPDNHISYVGKDLEKCNMLLKRIA